jgi:hypothetical protein
MSADTYVREISEFDLETFTELGAEASVTSSESAGRPPRRSPPPGMDEAARAKWEEKQEEEEAKFEARKKELEEKEELRRKQAAERFKAALEDRLTKEFKAGEANAVSREALRAVSVRSYVLLGVVAAVVSMPLIGMLLHLDPQAFGAYIAPITGITGTIVGYWFGTVGQSATGQGTTGQGATGQGTTRQGTT